MTRSAAFAAACALLLGWADPASAGVSSKLARLPIDEAWDGATRALLLEGYDLDRSGALDTRDEVAAVPCRVWRTVDRGYRAAHASLLGVRVSYGFVARPDSSFVYVGDVALGVAPGVQIRADEAMAACRVAR